MRACCFFDVRGDFCYIIFWLSKFIPSAHRWGWKTGTDGWLFQLGCSILSPIHPQILLFPPPCPAPGCRAAFFLLFPRVRALAGAAPRRDRGAAGWLRSRNSEKMKNFSREEEGCCLFVEKTKKTPIFYYSSSFFVVCFCLWLTKKKKKTNKVRLAGILLLIKNCRLSQKKSVS